jgi:hypothetical protein
MGSYLGWVRSRTDHPEGLVGPAGERAVHDALRRAAGHGLTFVNPDTGKVRSLLGADVPGGPLDNALWITQLDPSTARPRPQVLAPIEVKNIRHWVYPSSDEIFQLLYKAAALQAAHPDVPIYPIFFCRARSYTLDRMARDLGFRVVNARQQFLLRNSTVRREILEGVRSGLGFSDLVLLDEAEVAITTLADVARLFPREASANALRWASIGARFREHYLVLRDESLPAAERSETLADFHAEVRGVLGGRRLVWESGAPLGR